MDYTKLFMFITRDFPVYTNICACVTAPQQRGSSLVQSREKNKK